jgi:putative membrane protein
VSARKLSETSRRRSLHPLTIIAVILVPLAFAGLFVGALGDPDTATERIPAAVVNEDELIYQTADDGSETPVFAGRQLVTELIADDSFDWTISNTEDAEQALTDGDVHAILTIPSDFSASILSMSGDDPKQATLGIETDDAHSYLTGVVSETVGSGMAHTFGTEITAQYITGITSGLGELGTALGKAADGADQLASGAAGLSSGLADLAAGAATAGSGAADFASGVERYTAGVDQLANGLGALNTGAAGLGQVSAGVNGYTTGMGELSRLIAAEVAAINRQLAADPAVSPDLTTLNYLSGELATAAAGGAQLAQQVSGGVAGVQGAIRQSASAATQLAAGSASLRSGASSLADGVGGLASGVSSATSGAESLSSGAGELAAGLHSGAAQVPAVDEGQREASARLAADPVGVSVTRNNEVAEPNQALAAFLVPLGLWLGALAIFLVERRLSTRVLASTARSGRLLWAQLGPATLIALAQAAVLVALLHLGLGLGWSLLPVTLGFAAITAVAFTAFHFLLTALFGRAGLVISLFAVAIQITATGGLYPIQLLSEPFQAISPLLPLTHAVSGMQTIIAGAGMGPVVVAGLTLLAFGAISVLLSLVAVRRARRTAAFRLATA